LGIPSAFPRSRAQRREQMAGESQARGRNARKLGPASQTPILAIPPQSVAIGIIRDVMLITGLANSLDCDDRKIARRDGLKIEFNLRSAI
jgi:hypothetical protein